jgi:mannose-6-phosphate isomerase-like protein (cupin superfamily)
MAFSPLALAAFSIDDELLARAQRLPLVVTPIGACRRLLTTRSSEETTTQEETVMGTPEQKRRSFLIGLGVLGLIQLFRRKSNAQSQPATRQSYVLPAAGGEHLIHFRDHGNIFINVGSATGSDQLGFGTQQVTLGAGIPVHRHLQTDEAFFVLEGSGTVTLNDVRHSFEKGGTIFIPKNSWHSFENPDHELLLLWIVTPAGLDGFFRETCSPPDTPPKQLTKDQIKAIALKHGTEFR